MVPHALQGGAGAGAAAEALRERARLVDVLADAEDEHDFAFAVRREFEGCLQRRRGV